ncbi:unnamed protein product [Somion occarium]|uniref:C2H2-type domain-containing protein n=1 Tax=Somion occarium TaxID=3059160 RepID=A0ABP1DNA0_9APHY
MAAKDTEQTASNTTQQTAGTFTCAVCGFCGTGSEEDEKEHKDTHGVSYPRPIRRSSFDSESGLYMSRYCDRLFSTAASRDAHEQHHL